MMKIRRITLNIMLAALLMAGPVNAADLRIQSGENMVGAGHATMADTLNRLTLVDHNNDGTHKLSGFQAEMYACHNNDGTHKLSGFQAEMYAADAGSDDDYAVTLTPAPSAYFNGMVVNFIANTVNTGAATLNVNSLGAKTIKKQYNADLEDGDIPAGGAVSVIYDGTNFQIIGPVPSGASSVLVQIQHASIATLVSGSTQIPNDNTIPQNTEGFEVLTCAITPTSADNDLLIMASINLTNSPGTGNIVALFQDSVANAIAAVGVAQNNNSAVLLTHKMVAGTTSEITLKIRVGPSTSETVYVNAIVGSTTVGLGGVASTTITIFEYTP